MRAYCFSIVQTNRITEVEIENPSYVLARATTRGRTASVLVLMCLILQQPFIEND